MPLFAHRVVVSPAVDIDAPGIDQQIAGSLVLAAVRIGAGLQDGQFGNPGQREPEEAGLSAATHTV